MHRLSRSRSPRLFVARCLAALAAAALLAGCAHNPPFDNSGSSTGANGASGNETKAQSGGTTVAIKNFLYQPGTLTVPAGTTVTWTQLDVIPHTVTSGRPGGEDAGTIFDNTLSNVNQTYSFTFDKPGTFAYFCRFHPEMVAGVVVTGSSSGSPAATQTTSPRVAPTPTPPPPAGAKLVADKLINPRGFTWGPDGALYVAEAGTKPGDTASSEGGAPPPGPVKPGCESWRPSFDRFQAHCPGVSGPTIGSNGRIEKFAPDGTRTVVADKLPVVDGPFAATMGVTSVAFIGQELYTVIAAGETRGAPKFPTGVYKVNGDGSVTLWANLEAFQKANPPKYIPPDYNFSNPYDMVAMNGKLYISDGNACVIFEVDPAATQNKRVRRLADMSVGHPITTGIAAGADGNVYVTIMTIPPYPPGAAKVFKIGASGTVTEVGTGLSLGTGLAIGPDGTFYVAEFATALGKAPYVVPPGRVMKLVAGGTPQQVAVPLMYPGMLRWGPDGLYSDAFSIGTNEGATPLGAIYRLDSTATGGK